MWQTAYRTIYSNISLTEYFQQAGEYSQAGNLFTPDDIYLGEYVAAVEALNAGTTTVLDHAHATFSDSAVDAAVNASFDSGIRSFFAFAIHQLSNGYSLDEQISKFRSMTNDRKFFEAESHVRLGLAYDRLSLAPQEEIETVWDLAQTGNVSVVTMHWVGGSYGFQNSAELANTLGWLNTSTPLVFSHASNPTTEDAYLLRSTDQYISTTPESEMQFGLPQEFSHLLMDQASLGVDAHFTFGSSMATQARIWLQAVRARLYFLLLNQWEVPINNPMSARQAFQLATQHGGLALRRPDLGVLKVGAQADVVVWNTESPNMVGWRDPIAAIMLHSDVADVEDVLVGGQFMKRSGAIIDANYGAISRQFQTSARKIQDLWQSSSWPAIHGENQIGLAYVVADQVDTFRGNGSGY